MRAKLDMIWKLSFAALVSSLLASIVSAHELQPAVVDIEALDGNVVLTLDLNLEAYLAGINLDGLDDTDDAAGSNGYDDLRARRPADLAELVPDLVAAWNAVPLAKAADGPLMLQVQSVEVPEPGNVELVRTSRLVLTAQLTSSDVTVTWPVGAGDMVLRQQSGSEGAFTGYLSGGDSSPALAINVAKPGGLWRLICWALPCQN